jgi:hypothetical protein
MVVARQALPCNSWSGLVIFRQGLEPPSRDGNGLISLRLICFMHVTSLRVHSGLQPNKASPKRTLPSIAITVGI